MAKTSSKQTKKHADVQSDLAPEAGDAARVDFGFEDIPLEQKQGRVNGVFERVASRYDVMNDVMSLGVHRLWKQAFVTAIAPPRSARPFRLLDLASGTGDIAQRVLARSGTGTTVVASDINPAMLAEGQRRLGDYEGRLSFEIVNAESIPFPDNSFDAVSIAFGLRNVPRRQHAFAEILRVLKPMGQFACLEFSHTDVPILAEAYDFYSFHVIPRIGGLIAGDEASYQYLVESIRRFPKREALADEMRAAGFARVKAEALSGGVVAIHTGWKG
jgi:demethylmenaquinone methyltransferase / 2-methoxy-6-polyprenyl-1,4-benzoquinol methylase